MERLSVFAAVSLVAVATLACKGGKGDAEATDAAVTVTAASASASPSAAPTTERYGDEQALDGPVPITLKKDTPVHATATEDGAPLATAKSGTKVTATAVRGDYALVTLDSGTSGWIGGDAVRDALAAKKPAAAATVAGPPRGGCKPGMILDDDRKVVCVPTCTKNTDCMSGPCEPTHGGKGCTSDEGELLPTKVDPSAGAKPAGDSVLITEGQSCPPSWVSLPGWVCARPCKSDADCHAKHTCQAMGDQHFCDPSTN
jgi:hypothetical protein